MSVPVSFQSFVEPWLLFLAEDPLLRLTQGAMLLLAAFIIFLVFYTTRDILLRTHSFFYMFFCIVLVSILPVVGFLLYLLIRPARTIKEREAHELLKKIAKNSAKSAKKTSAKKAAPKSKKK